MGIAQTFDTHFQCGGEERVLAKVGCIFDLITFFWKCNLFFVCTPIFESMIFVLEGEFVEGAVNKILGRLHLSKSASKDENGRFHFRARAFTSAHHRDYSPGSTKRRMTMVRLSVFNTKNRHPIFHKIARHGSKFTFDKTDLDHFPVRVFLFFPKK